MGCVQSSGLGGDEKAKARNDEIENQLTMDRMMARNNVKILLLGAGESGKSTVLKQMKLIHSGGYNDQERESYKEIIFSNAYSIYAVSILGVLPQLNLSLIPRNNAHRDTLLALSMDWNEVDDLPRGIADSIRSLWKDPNVKEADILRSRVKTTGITEMTFKVGELTYNMFDVGGQQSERKKWIHCFENVNMLLFLVSLPEYDMTLYEDENVNRVQEALILFDSICNSRWFLGTTIVLFLNKIDLFAEKLHRSPLSDYFPDYNGGEDYAAASNYLHNRFVSRNKRIKPLFAYYTCATDTQKMKLVLNNIHDIILRLNVNECVEL
ncbi:G protein alpha-subunit [Gymnopus androsaceus JB14]|uniref:G protein alpha-subunit n=1 Tax=Gymnopus androsaceus JB14 TaxID=1447944 RepID=A0A6A4HE20_9AGAR|nr:G protein alpha-subunit [Gymnopus androsaceus JB14]